MKKAIPKFLLFIILLSMLVSLLRINIVRASPAIVIRFDGTVDPPGAPIARLGNVYTFTNNITEDIRIQRSNIILDGAGYALIGSGSGRGIENDFGFILTNVTIQNIIITNFSYGIALESSSNNTIIRNTIVNNGVGIDLFEFSSFNTISGNEISGSVQGISLSADRNTVSENTITNNTYGLWLQSSYNTISRNTIRRNTSFSIVLIYSSANTFSENTIENNSNGISLDANSRNNIIMNNTIANNTGNGISLSSSYNVVLGNTITNTSGVYLYPLSNNNIISSNTIRRNTYGLFIRNATDNKIFHNNFMNNTQQVFFQFSGYPNIFDDSYPSGGNYWSNYAGVDFYNGQYQNVTGRDGVGDTPFILDANNTDGYPFMGMFHGYNAYPGYRVDVVSNSKIDSFMFFKLNSTIIMQVSNMSAIQLFGFLRVVIPKGLMAPPYEVKIDNGLTQPSYINDTLYDNSTHRWVYFEYLDATHLVEIKGADIIPPVITILSPEGKTYRVKYVPLTFTVDESTSWMGYSLNGQANVTVSGNTTLTALSEGAHTIAVYANDTSGNMGRSNTVSFSVDTVAPNISILSPENKTYTTSSVALTFTVNELTSWIGYSLNGQTNVTITGNTTLSALPNGSHRIKMYAADTTGNYGSSNTVYFTVQVSVVDTTPPTITILSPENKTYTTTDAALTMRISEAASWIAYSLDNGANVTIAGNITLTTLTTGAHSILVYANDTVGNMGKSSRVYFTVSLQRAEPFPPTWLIVAVAIIVIAIVVGLLVYFTKIRKAPSKVT